MPGDDFSDYINANYIEVIFNLQRFTSAVYLFVSCHYGVLSLFQTTTSLWMLEMVNDFCSFLISRTDFWTVLEGDQMIY